MTFKRISINKFRKKFFGKLINMIVNNIIFL